ncbi:hypothetical protein [Sinorhizobium mexicanum]|uniref:Uncharacterized protein n=1 Tax=Sinorhizobium mexicanum TaxID=375549 RepID=A0A859R172_9HYPH|nr:hypothetical protein [Sinorhizobium mexicanum]MBP1884437.1 hypothetical protein [Sinorhizobium mexicanum]QLL65369.1 hypothetical protein FKV68_28910 [Sinorhizobium mexicanum]
MQDFIAITSACGTLQFDPAVGNIPRLRFHWAERWIEPLHAAPWRNEPNIEADPALSPAERRLAGDFFCAPFAAAADPAVPAHGWTANSPWLLEEHEAGRVRLALARDVSGATVTKNLGIAEDAPLLYQEHVIEGGQGILPVSHHPMVHLSGRGRFFTSKKRAILTPEQPLEPGRSCLAYPMRAVDLTEAVGAEGGTVDLTRWPIARRNEDFVTLVEAPGAAVGWTAVIREDEDDIVFFLKDPAILPVTMLWFSNGGREYAPWNGRHLGVTGIEDGCCPGLAGEAAAARANPISAEGVATGLALADGHRHVVRHVTGAVPRPSGWTEIAAISAEGDWLTIADAAGRHLVLPWRSDFLEGQN